MAGAGEEDAVLYITQTCNASDMVLIRRNVAVKMPKGPPYLRAVNAVYIRHIVQFLAELALRVFPLGFVLAVKERGLLTQPVRHVGALLGDEVDFESCFGEHQKRVQSFTDEETRRVAIVQRRGGRGDGDDDAAWETHLGTIKFSLVAAVSFFVEVKLVSVCVILLLNKQNVEARRLKNDLRMLWAELCGGEWVLYTTDEHSAHFPEASILINQRQWKENEAMHYPS